MRARATDRSIVALAAAMMAVMLASCATSTAPNGAGTPSPPTQPEDPRKALVERRCTMCHTIETVYSKDYDAEQWDETIERMKRNGLVITDEEKQQVIEYLVSRTQQ